MTTLTDRYVEATLTRVPARQRPDIERELRAAIADAIDDRLETGDTATEAENAVLTQLGDPARLAAGYADRPLHLIGPKLYLDYLRLLKALLATIVPAVVAVVAIVRTLGGDTAPEVIGAAISAGFTAGLHVAFWTTLAFAIIERTPAARSLPTRGWTPAALPEPPTKRMRYSELITETVALVLFGTFILLSPVVSTETDAAGKSIGLLSPWLWETGVVYLFLALVTASLGFSFARYYVRWNLPLAIIGSLVDIACPVIMIWLAISDHILNPAFVTAAGWPANVSQWVETAVIVSSILAIVHTVTQEIGQARRR